MEQETPIRLIGSWNILSVRYTMSDNGEIIDEPLEGVCSFDANGRWTVFAMPRATAAPTNDTERAAIYSRLVAFSGRCAFESDRLEVRPDFVWNPSLKGVLFIRFFSLDEDRLTITQPEWEHPFFPGRKTVATILWERDR